MEEAKLQYSPEQVFDMLQDAYKRGADFACENLKVNDEDYKELWLFVPKAAYDYSDKSVPFKI